MKKLFKKKKKKSASEAGSLADISTSGYDISPKKDLNKLHRAAFEGDLTKLKTLLKKGNVNELDIEKRTPLHLACATGKIDVVKMLADHPKIEINISDKEGRTPLMKCVQCQFHNCLDILLRKGADLSQADINGNTALHLAVSLPSTEITFLLLDYGIDVHSRNKDESTPLHVAASVSGSEEIIKTLIADGAAIDARNRTEKTPLMIAASRGYISVVRQLLQSGADASLEDSSGWMANDLANSNGHHPLSYIIVEHSIKRSGPRSRPSSGNFGVAAASPLTARLSSAGTPKRIQSPTSSVARSSIKDEFLGGMSSIAGGPAIEIEETTQDEEDTMSKKSNDKNDLWSITDDDSNGSLDEEDAKPAKVNVMQFLRNREQTKKVSNSPPPTATTTKKSEDSMRKELPQAKLESPKVANPSKSNHREYMDKDIDDSNSWFVSSSSSDADDEDDNNADIKNKLFGAGKKNASVKGPKSDPPKSAVISGKNNEAAKDVSNNNLPTVKSNAKKASPAPNTSVKKRSTWDSTDDEGSSEEEQPNAYMPSVSVKRNLANELGFDDDELGLDASVSDVSDSESVPDSNPLESKAKKKPQKEKEEKQSPRASTSSDWDSDAEDQESQEHFAANGANFLTGTNNLKFDDETSSSDDEIDVGMPEPTKPVEASKPPIAALRSTKDIDPAPKDSLLKKSSNDAEEDTPFSTKLQANNLGDTGRHSPSIQPRPYEKPAAAHSPSHSPRVAITKNIPYLETEEIATPLPKQRSSKDTDTSPVKESSMNKSSNDVQQSIPPSTELQANTLGNLNHPPSIEPRSHGASREPPSSHKPPDVQRDGLESNKDVPNFSAHEREEMVAQVRRLNFELAAIREREKTYQLEMQTEREGSSTLNEDLQIERNIRRKLEVTIRDLKHELQSLKQTLNTVEEDRNRLQEELAQEIRQSQVRNQLEMMNDKVEKQTNRGSMDALNLMLQEKDQQIAHITSERDTMYQNNLRYKQELEELQRSDGDSSDILSKLNMELNNKIDMLSQEKCECEELLHQNALHFKCQFDQFQQTIVELNNKMTIESDLKQEATQELGKLKHEQEKLKINQSDLEAKLSEEKKLSDRYQRELTQVTQSRDEHLKKLHGLELSDGTRQHDLTALRTNFTIKENEVAQLRQDNETKRKEIKEVEQRLHDARIDNASLNGKIESLQVELTQLDSERLRLKSELESTRASETVGLTEHQEKFNNLISENNRERIELEKLNATLNQQVAYLKEEIEKLGKQKLEKESELAFAQQDRIEQCKALSFTESSMAQLSESQRMLCEDKKKMEENTVGLQKKVEALNSELKEMELRYERKISAESVKHLQETEGIRKSLSEKINFLQTTLDKVQIDKDSLNTQVCQLKEESQKQLHLAEHLENARVDLEEQLSSHQEELKHRQNQLREKDDKIKMFETEVHSHRDTWEQEVKSRLKLSVELRKVENDRDEAIRLCEQYKHRLVHSVEEGKTFEAKHSIQRKKIISMREELENSRLTINQQVQRRQEVEAEQEARDERLDREQHSYRSNREFEDLEDKVNSLQTKCRDREMRLERAENERRNLERQLEKLYNERNEKGYLENADGSKLVEEIQFLKNELSQEKEKSRSSPHPYLSPSGRTININETEVRSIINGEVNAKLEQINSFLEEQSEKHDNLEKIRRENEETRMLTANRKIDELQRQLELERAKNTINPSYVDKRVARDLEKSLRENSILRENLSRTSTQLNEQQQQRRSSKEHRESMEFPPPPYNKNLLDFSRSLNFNNPVLASSTGSVPLHLRRTASDFHPNNTAANASIRTFPVQMMTSTPTREDGTHNPMYNKMVNNIDTALRRYKNDQQSSTIRLSGGNSRSADPSRSNYSRDYERYLASK